MGTEYIVTPEALICFAHFYEPWSSKPQYAKKFRATLVYPNGTDVNAIASLIDEAGFEKFGEAYPQMKPTLKIPMKDGNQNINKKTGQLYEGFANTVYFDTSTQITQPPTAIGADGAPTAEPNYIYSGCYGKALINAYAYDTGICLGLAGIQKTKDGPRLGGGGPGDVSKHFGQVQVGGQQTFQNVPMPQQPVAPQVMPQVQPGMPPQMNNMGQAYNPQTAVQPGQVVPMPPQQPGMVQGYPQPGADPLA